MCPTHRKTIDGAQIQCYTDHKTTHRGHRLLQRGNGAISVTPFLSQSTKQAFATKVQKRPKAEVQQEAEALLDRVGLLAKKNSYPRELSGGQKQRVAIVRALCMHPEILLFDEVTAALDPEMVREVLDVMLDLAKQGKTMIIVTHEMQFARAIANRVIFLDGGKIVEEAAPAEFFDRPKTERAQRFLRTFTFDAVK